VHSKYKFKDNLDQYIISMNYTIRRLDIKDYDRYLPLINEFRSTIFSKDDFTDFLNSLPKNIQIWIIENDETIVATGTLIIEPKLIFNITKLAHIEDICVLTKYRKQKFGSIIVKHLIKVAKEEKCYKVSLTCSDKVSKFYLSNGFEERGLQCSQLL